MSNAKVDCENLLAALMPLAERLLTKYREFFPFGGTMSSDGEVSHSDGWAGEERPPSSEVIELLQKEFRAGAEKGDYKATALVYDICTIPPGKTVKQDAIAVALDHRLAYSVVVIFPYTFDSDGQLHLEAPFAAEGDNKIFM